MEVEQEEDERDSVTPVPATSATSHPELGVLAHHDQDLPDLPQSAKSKDLPPVPSESSIQFYHRVPDGSLTNVFYYS